MSISYNYVELNTFNEIRLGAGSQHWKHWGIMDHAGIIIDLMYLGFKESKKCFLPAYLLRNLYSNFDNKFQYGGILFAGDWYELIAEKYYSLDKADDLYERNIGFIPINYKDEEEGYPFLIPLLPELNDLSVIDSISNDPTLNVELFYKTLDNKLLGGNVDNQIIYKYRHPRWSEEWLMYCKKIMSEDFTLKIIDESNFLRIPLS